jgi:hypothetical protein
MDSPPALLQSEGWAYLDWITGLVRIDADASFYQNCVKKFNKSEMLTEDEILLLETVAHESFHYLQICTSAYLYNLSRRLYDALSKYLEKQPVTCYEDLRNWPPPGLKEEFAFHIALLNVEGPQNVSALSIVDSAAFYVQKLRCRPNLTANAYEEMLVGELLQYHHAYKVAVGCLGREMGFQLFPLLAAMSLWTMVPQETFPALCEGLAKLGPDALRKVDFDQFLREVSPYYAGTPLVRGGAEIPIYNQTICALDKLYKSHELDLYMLMAKPHVRLNDSLTNVTVPPMVFKNTTAEGDIFLSFPDHLWPALVRVNPALEGNRAKIGKMLLLLLELSARITRTEA